MSTLQFHGLYHARLLCPPLWEFDQIYVRLSQWHFLTISSCAGLFSFSFNLSQHQCLFQGVSSSHQVAKVLEFEQQSFPMNIQVDFLKDWLVWLHSIVRNDQTIFQSSGIILHPYQQCRGFQLPILINCFYLSYCRAILFCVKWDLIWFTFS